MSSNWSLSGLERELISLAQAGSPLLEAFEPFKAETHAKSALLLILDEDKRCIHH